MTAVIHEMIALKCAGLITSGMTASQNPCNSQNIYTVSHTLRPKCQTPLHAHRLQTCCTTPPTDELTTIRPFGNVGVLILNLSVSVLKLRVLSTLVLLYRNLLHTSHQPTLLTMQRKLRCYAMSMNAYGPITLASH